MKEIKAYVRSSRIADVIVALKESPSWGGIGARGHHLAVSVVRGDLLPFDNAEKHYAMDLSDEIINEYKVEILCEDSDVDALSAALITAARTGQDVAGWLVVIDVVNATPFN